MRRRRVPFPTPWAGPEYIFRLVERDERATYVRIMRRTYVVALRDFGRQVTRAQRAVGRQLLPAMERLAAVLKGHKR